MDYTYALKLAEDAKDVLAPYCTRYEIAGSIRRKKAQPKDVELLVQPRAVAVGLFGDEVAVDPDFCAVVNQWTKVKGEPTGRYTQRVLPGGIILDLFIADADNWGWLLCLRTGSADFNRTKMLPALKARGYVLDEGYILKDGIRLSTPEEQDVFALAGLIWVEPWNRSGPIR